MLVFAVLCALPAKAAAQQKVFLILWHGLAWEDIQASPFYNEGIMAVGTMNTCTGGGEPVTGAYLTIACGSRAFGVADAALMLHSDEQLQGHPAGEVYTVRTGRSSQGDAIVNPQIAAVEHAFDQASYPLELGALAESLRQAGLGLVCLATAISATTSAVGGVGGHGFLGHSSRYVFAAFCLMTLVILTENGRITPSFWHK